MDRCEKIREISPRRKVLLIAYKIAVGEGSEPGAGWASLLGHLRLGSIVHLISTTDNLDKLDLPREFIDKVEFSQIDLNENKLRIFRRIPFYEQLAYAIWNLKVRKFLIQRISTHYYDIIHQSTFAGDWNPSCILWNIPGNLFWGPIGGTQRVPIATYRWLGLKGSIIEIVRIVITSPLRNLNRKLAKKNNVNVLVANEKTYNYFSKNCKVSFANQIVLNHVTAQKKSRDSDGSKILIGSGRLISWKMWPLAIKSASSTKLNFDNFSIFGEGEEKGRLVRLIKKLNQDNLIQIRSAIPREKILELLSRTDVYIFPSLKDSSPWSLAEAIHLGVPIAAYNISGVREMVNEPEINLASISGNLVTNLAAKIMQPYRVSELNAFCECKLLQQYREIFYEK